MKVKRIFLCTLLCIVSFSMVCAQSEQKARKVLDKAASVLKEKGGASANFTISSKKMGTVKGAIALKGNKFKTKTTVATIWYNGKTQWTYMPKNDEVNVTTPTKAQQQTMNPYAFINLYRNGYKFNMTQKGNNYEVHMVSQKQNNNISEVYVTLNRTSYVLSHIRIKNGNEWTNISISNFKTQKLSDNLFVFSQKEYPNAEIIDLR